MGGDETEAKAGVPGHLGRSVRPARSDAAKGWTPGYAAMSPFNAGSAEGASPRPRPAPGATAKGCRAQHGAGQLPPRARGPQPWPHASHAPVNTVPPGRAACELTGGRREACRFNVNDR